MTTVDPKVFQYLVIASALEMWAKHKIKANRSYTPKNMIGTAGRLLGREFAPRDYMGAAKALRDAVEAAKRNKREL
jgi:hypothetical protein